METSFFITNRKKFTNTLEDQSLALFFAGEAPQSSADEHYEFVPNRNFYYLSGIDQPKIILLFTKYHGKVTEHLFVEKADPVMAKWIGESMSKEQATAVSGIETTHHLEDLQSFIQSQLHNRNYQHVYFDLEKRAWDAPETASQRYAGELSKRYPSLQIHNAYHTVSDLRLIKSSEEIEEIREAGRITSEGIKHLIRHAKPGMKEYELEAYFDFVLKSNGVKRHAFRTIVASGKNATVLHYEDNNDVVNDGELVLLDLGAQWNYYSGDISFTFPANGTFSERQKTIYNIVLKALREVSEMVKPGVTLRELHEQTQKILADECISIGLIQDPKEISKYFYHGVGHSLGLDTHDVGAIFERELEPGMVITIEPGLYIEEEGIGIRIEDDVLVTETGFENLTPDLPRTVEEIEAFLAENK